MSLIYLISHLNPGMSRGRGSFIYYIKRWGWKLSKMNWHWKLKLEKVLGEGAGSLKIFYSFLMQLFCSYKYKHHFPLSTVVNYLSLSVPIVRYSISQIKPVYLCNWAWNTYVLKKIVQSQLVLQDIHLKETDAATDGGGIFKLKLK